MSAAKRTTLSPLDKAKGNEVVWSQVAPVFEAMKPFDGACFVYFIGEPDNGMMKIGHSKDPISRLRTMQTGNPRRLKIEYVLVGGGHIERLLHEFCEQWAVRSVHASNKPKLAPGTEWFDPAIREKFLPLIAKSAERQAAFLELAEGDVTELRTEKIVRDTIAESGWVHHRRDQVILMAPVMGQSISRRSRVADPMR